MSWIEIGKQIPFNVVAKSCNMTQRSRRWGPCPACGTEKKSDNRPPVNTLGDTGWICNTCHSKGDTIDLVSYHLNDEPYKDNPKPNVRKHFESLDGSVSVATADLDLTGTEYPPNQEVRGIWSSGHQINKSPSAMGYLEGRGINPQKIVGLARVANIQYRYGDLTWVQRDDKRKPWWPTIWAQQFSIILPLYNHNGELTSIHGRSTKPENKRKTTCPLNYTSRGLLFLNEQAINFVKGNTIPKAIWIAEGEIDFLSLAQYDVPVIGIRSGSVTALKQLPWTYKTKALIATDADEQGDKYAEKIVDHIIPALPFRVSVARLTKAYKNGGAQ